MELTPEIIEYCESKSWDEDLRQEVYIKLLEKEHPGDHWRNFVGTVYNGLRQDRDKVQGRRQEILQENEDEVRALFTRHSYGDPAQEYEATEEIKQRLDRLSPLLRDTLEAIAIDGRSYEDVAEEQGVGASAIRERYRVARNTMEEMING